MDHGERHRIQRVGWLRAAVLGANDGIISTASLIIGVAAANTPRSGIIIAGCAGLIAGAMSMATGEYISVSSQRDTEKAEILREKKELEEDPESEVEELTAIYVRRGLDYPLAKQVALSLMAFDALGAHSRDELGITETLSARPFQAAISSACSFTFGALLPLLMTAVIPTTILISAISIFSIILLALLGSFAAKAGGSKVLVGTLRVMIWGSVAMFLSALIGHSIGQVL